MCPQDIDFLNALKERSRIAFNDLYDRYAPTLFGIIIEIVGNQPQAEAILRDTFVTIWKNIHLYDPDKGRFFLWLVHIARTTALDYLHHQSKCLGPILQQNSLRIGRNEQTRTTMLKETL
jgi:RNA polymerase sigma factor (sigma-70 family)